MCKQPYEVSFDDTKTADFVNAAKRSGKKEAEVRERSQQILGYYRGDRARKIKK